MKENNRPMKFIFVTGGVLSSLGKGISAAMVGRLLKKRGLNIFSIKLDPYLNVDPGTMSPTQHGEVFVTKDGGEADLDLGHYERLIGSSLTKESTVTSGKIYSTVIENERKGTYLGATIQVIPHITNEIKRRIFTAFNAKDDTDVCIVEIGGTVGDMESLPYLEAIRQIRNEFGSENTFFMHATYVPILKTTGEIKTKPTQHSVKELTGLGIQPDALLLRCETKVAKADREKVALFCNLPANAVFSVEDMEIIYEIAINLRKQKLDDLICNKLKFKNISKTTDLTDWEELVDKIKNLKKTVNIALVGKYVKLHDAYISVNESLKYAGYAVDRKVNIIWIDSEKLETDDTLFEKLKSADGIIVPGGFGQRGTEGKMKAIKYARENNIPFLGLCLGLQCALIEFARNVLKLKKANSTEFDEKTPYPIIDYMPNQYKDIIKGGTMRLGDYDCEIDEKSLTYSLYKEKLVKERHRHRYEFNNKFKKEFEEKGMRFVGINPQTKLIEIIELPSNKYFVACQFHPEFLSRPLRPHPLFLGFVKASIKDE